MDRVELERGLAELGQQIESLRNEFAGKSGLLERLPDIQIFYNAVRYALIYNEFFNPRETAIAKDLLGRGMHRARLLKEWKTPWTEETGMVVRGYVSKIDGSVQPYGLVMRGSNRLDTPHRYRLDIWLHGRGETLSELNFLDQRLYNPGEFLPEDTIVLHPYGRYCNANKFAGEVDLFEALEHVKKSYRIDENRITVRGFSMGGAACWQFAAHFPGHWAAAAPGAGFAESAQFLKVFQNETVQPTWWEQKLWHMYDATDYALNFTNLPTVAYSGENDRQKQAADVMASAMKAEGLDLVHVIGPKTGHSYHPHSKAEISRRIDAIVSAGRNPVPPRIRFTTWTLRYNRCAWFTLEGLERHWERAVVHAELRPPDTVAVTTKNVTALALQFDSGACPLTTAPIVVIDGQRIKPQGPHSDRSWTARFRKNGRRWSVVGGQEPVTLRKRHGLQGPIDDAFMDSFLIVRPTANPLNEKVGGWVHSEMERAIVHWRKQFRGEARVKDDSAVTDEDIAAHNLILWGDPASNRVLARIADRLPLQWKEGGIRLGAQKFAADRHAPILIYPNPLNPARYVVLNSGFTFREYDYLNNARQTPKLPDYAIIDLDTPPDARWPGKVVEAGFFDEQWRLQPEAGRGGARK